LCMTQINGISPESTCPLSFIFAAIKEAREHDDLI
jgi:hypothetical protein